jgi:triosephosphate isomerase
MPTTIVAGNWKMNTTVTEAGELAGAVREKAGAAAGVEVILCPPSISLVAVRDAVAGSPVKIGAQNMHFDDAGAYTGEIAPPMLPGICDYVILGHSERRQLFGETDETVNRKVLAAIRHGLQPILCVGETLEQRESGQAANVITGQVSSGLAGCSAVDINGLVVAYEPVWAIGTGQAATPEIAAEVMGGAILETLRSLFGAASEEVPLLYGGSVNAGNIADFAAQYCIHGALVGGASLQADSFMEIARRAGEVRAAGV